jgi:hypothetical protein
MNIGKAIDKAGKKLLAEQARTDKELAGLRKAILALGKRALGKAKARGRRKMSPRTIRKMKAAQRKRRAAEGQQKAGR